MTALGGARNLSEVAACTTRLRLDLVDNRAIESRAEAAGRARITASSATGLQVVLAPSPTKSRAKSAMRCARGRRRRPGGDRHGAARRREAATNPISRRMAALGGRNNLGG